MADTTHDADDYNTEGEYIPKSYQFERDMEDGSLLNDRSDTFVFDENSNDNFVYSSMADLFNNLDDLRTMLETFASSQRERIEILEDYSSGQNYAIRNGRRRIEENKADYRIRHNYGGYISSFVTGYVLGKPLTVAYQGDEEDLSEEELANIEDVNDLDSLNYELAYDTSRYGRAFELHWRDDKDNDRITLIDPKDMFVIRSYDVTNKLIGAVHCPVFNSCM